MSRRFYTVLMMAVMVVSATAWADPAIVSVDGSVLTQQTAKPFRNDPRNFQFAIVGDNTGGPRPGVFEQAIDQLNLLNPEFVISVGDLINGVKDTRDTDVIDAMWVEMMGILDRLDAPFFLVPGNHDIYNEVMRAEWDKRFGSPHYAFLYRDVLFMVLNTQDPPRTGFGEAQADWAIATLAKHPEVRWTLVFLHQPVWDYGEEYPAWGRVETALQDRDYTVFFGHTHTYLQHERFGRRYINLAVTGGAIPHPSPTEFDHLTWVTMTDEGPEVAILRMDGILPEHFATARSKDLYDFFDLGVALRCDPIWLDDPASGPPTAVVALTNPADVPLHVKGNLPAQAGVDRAFSETLAPGETKDLRYPLTLADRDRRPGAPPIPFEWTGRFDDPVNPVEYEGTAAIPLESRIACKHVRRAKTIDGDLRDWRGFPYECRVPAEVLFDTSTWTGPEDASFRFNVTLDKQYLNLAIDVTDNEILFQNHPTPWQQDAVKVWLDARPETQRHDYAYPREFEDFLLMAFSPGETPDASVIYKPDLQPAGTQMACRRTDAGYAVEIAIPLDYLEETGGQDWTSFRLDIGVDDYDFDAPQRAEIWWRPTWPEMREYAHSGTFLR